MGRMLSEHGEPSDLLIVATILCRVCRARANQKTRSGDASAALLLHSCTRHALSNLERGPFTHADRRAHDNKLQICFSE